MWIIRIDPPKNKKVGRKSRTEFARTQEELAAIVTREWQRNQHAVVRVFRDEAPLIAELSTREKNHVESRDVPHARS